MNSIINAISYYLPEKKLTNEDLNQSFPKWSVDKISSKTGIWNRAIAAEDEFASDMGIKAAESLFEEYNFDRKKIDFLLYCTQSPDYFLPTTACIIQDKLGLSNKCGALDYNLGCSGYVYGLALADGLIKSGAAKNILLITSETYSKHIHLEDKSNRTIFGDAAAATIISSEGKGFKINGFLFGTDGKGAENLIVKNGGMKHKISNNDSVFDESGQFIKNNDYLFMDGKEIFAFTNQSIPGLVNDTLTKFNLSLLDVNLYIFHQANKFMLDFLRKKIGISDNNFFVFLKDCGNTVSSTIPIALKNALDTKNFKKDDKIMLVGFGVGYSWASSIIEYQ